MDQWIVGLIALTVQAGGIIAFVTWKLGDIRIEILTNRSLSSDALTKHQETDGREFASVRSDAFQAMTKLTDIIINGNDKLKREVGEGLAALRQKITDTEMMAKQIELWNRDHFLQKENHHITTSKLEGDINEKLNDLKEMIVKLKAP